MQRPPTSIRHLVPLVLLVAAISVPAVAEAQCPASQCTNAGCTLTQSLDTATNADNSIACSGGGLTTDQGWARCYSLAVEGVPTQGFQVQSVTFGVQQATADGINIDVVLYADGNGCPPGAPGADAVELARASVVVNMADAGSFLTVPFPSGPVVPSGNHLVVEIEQVDDGQALGFAFRPISNDAGQCGPSFIRAADCGIPGWIDIAAIGFPTAHLVQIVHGTPLFDYKCYRVRNAPGTPATPPRNVLLKDRAGMLFGSVAEPVELCNPVSKNGEEILDPVAHLLCWQLRTPGGAPVGQVDTVDQFGAETLSVGRTLGFCNPAYKNNEGCVAGPFGPVCDLDALANRTNHFQCHGARTATGTDPFVPLTVLLEDQFEAKSVTVVETRLYCDPLRSKNFEDVPVPDPQTHLKCYAIEDTPSQPAFAPRNVRVEDQFGRHTLRAVRPTRLCEGAAELGGP